MLRYFVEPDINIVSAPLYLSELLGFVRTLSEKNTGITMAISAVVDQRVVIQMVFIEVLEVVNFIQYTSEYSVFSLGVVSGDVETTESPHTP